MVQIPTVGKNHSHIYTELLVEKINHCLLYMYFPHVSWWKPLTPSIFAYLFSPVHHKSLRGCCCSLPKFPLHSRKEYMFVLNKCSIHSYSTALVWIHSYSSPAPSKTAILFRKRSWCITIGIKICLLSHRRTS